MNDTATAIAAVDASAFALGKALAKHTIPAEPPEYLAVLVFDGDSMGKWVQRHPGPVSRGISQFSERVSGLLGRKEGAAQGAREFYLGGDEGLILCPLARALDLAFEVKDLFASAMSEATAAAGSPPTLSAAIAVFDRERPLGSAIAVARRALERAKSQPEKASLCVSAMTASGSTFEAVGAWDGLWSELRTATDLVRQGRLSVGWLYDVEAFLTGIEADAWSKSSARSAIGAELTRLTNRRTAKPTADGTSGGAQIASNESTDGRSPESRLNIGGWFRNKPTDDEVSSLADGLHVMAFSLRAIGAHEHSEAEVTS